MVQPEPDAGTMKVIRIDLDDATRARRAAEAEEVVKTRARSVSQTHTWWRKDAAQEQNENL